MVYHYPDLIDIAKDKEKRQLKPVVMFSTDLDSLEEEMIKVYGTDSLHVAVVWRISHEGNDMRFHPEAGNR